MHIRAFVAKINQPGHRQPNKKPPGKTEEIQETVEVRGEEHHNRQRVLGEGTETELGESEGTQVRPAVTGLPTIFLK